jgi:hypothetical protein
VRERLALSLLDHDTIGFAVPTPPDWVREVFRDIYDAVAPAPMLALPWIGSVLLLIPAIAEPIYVFT